MIWRSAFGRLLLGAITYVLVCIAWTFFRAESFAQAWAMTGSMVWLNLDPAGRAVSRWDVLGTCVITIGIIAAHWALRDTTLESVVNRCPPIVWATVNAAMLVAISMTPGEDNAFIYFQF